MTPITSTLFCYDPGKFHLNPTVIHLLEFELPQHTLNSQSKISALSMPGGCFSLAVPHVVWYEKTRPHKYYLHINQCTSDFESYNIEDIYENCRKDLVIENDVPCIFNVSGIHCIWNNTLMFATHLLAGFNDDLIRQLNTILDERINVRINVIKPTLIHNVKLPVKFTDLYSRYKNTLHSRDKDK